jgi:hypothetical protein
MSQAGAAEVFSADERRALACLLDLVIPRSRDGRMPAAGELGLAAQIERVAQRDPGLRGALATGVAALGENARRRGGADFATLAEPDRLAALKEVAAAQPGFLPGLIFHTYVAYYQAGRVLEALGLAPQPPFPKGHVLEPFDAALLEPARRRGKLYRDV